MKTKNTTKKQNILICYNLFNDNKEFKYPCHAQLYGPTKEVYEILTKLCNMINNARKYNQAWITCYFINNVGKTMYKTPLILLEKGIKPSKLMRKIYLNE